MGFRKNANQQLRRTTTTIKTRKINDSVNDNKKERKLQKNSSSKSDMESVERKEEVITHNKNGAAIGGCSCERK